MPKKNCIICQKKTGKIAGNKTADKSILCDDCASEMGLPITMSVSTTMKSTKIIEESSDVELRSRHAEMANKSSNEFDDFKSGKVKAITLNFVSSELADVTLDQQGITIDKKGFLNTGIKGAKKVPFSNITDVHFKEAKKMTSGFLQFAILDVETPVGLISIAKDKYAIMFSNKKEENVAMLIRNFVDEKISDGNASEYNQAWKRDHAWDYNSKS